MKKICRPVSTGFWTDSKVLDIFSPEDKYFYLYLLTNPQTSQLGIYELPLSIAATQLGYSKDTVKTLLDRFQNKYKVIVCSEKNNEILIKNFLLYSVVKGGKPVMDCLLKEEQEVSDKTLLAILYDYLSKKEIENETVREYCEHISIYKSYISNNINNNNNENERIVDDSWTYRESTLKASKIKASRENGKSTFTPPTVEEVRTFCSEVGSQVDPEAFVAFYESNGWKVGKNPMKVWKSAIVTWEKRNNLKRITPAPKVVTPEPTPAEEVKIDYMAMWDDPHVWDN